MEGFISDIVLTEELGFVVSRLVLRRSCDRLFRRGRSGGGNGMVDTEIGFCVSSTSSSPLGSINGRINIPRIEVDTTRKMKAAVSDDSNGNRIAKPLQHTD